MGELNKWAGTLYLSFFQPLLYQGKVHLIDVTEAYIPDGDLVMLAINLLIFWEMGLSRPPLLVIWWTVASGSNEIVIAAKTKQTDTSTSGHT